LSCKENLVLEAHRTMMLPTKTHANKPSAQLTGSGATVTLPLLQAGITLVRSVRVESVSPTVPTLPKVIVVEHEEPPAAKFTVNN